jgi:hypothetical protein
MRRILCTVLVVGALATAAGWLTATLVEMATRS